MVVGGVVRENGGHPIAPRDLDAIRTCAERARAEGNRHIREQFANGAVSFEVVLGGHTTELLYETDGGNHCAGIQLIWDYVTRRA